MLQMDKAILNSMSNKISIPFTTYLPMFVLKCLLISPPPPHLDLSAKALSTSCHIWLLCVTLVLTLLEGQR